jgi:starvation-inducible DNA-binding protein
MKIDNGLSQSHREQIAAGLSRLLADSYTLYLKTHNFHWNVTGPHFKSLHELFEAHYTELAAAVDEIAERIRALGIKAPGSYKQFAQLTSIEEETGHPNWKTMVEQLVVAHETVVKTARSMLELVDQADDEVTLGLLGARMDVHEKTAWMLRSLVE